MPLGNDTRQHSQLCLDVGATPRGEAQQAGTEATEALPAAHGPERLAGTDRPREAGCARETLKKALRQVKANNGSPGLDGMTVEPLPGYLQQHWPASREQLLPGTYRPPPVKRVEIPQPDGGGRKLGIPTVLARFIQQAVRQVLQRQWDPTCSDHR